MTMEKQGAFDHASPIGDISVYHPKLQLVSPRQTHVRCFPDSRYINFTDID